jgi:NAD(P)-dependent dehydrogenase (short-subunit alcohol dehydrogenase family)
MFKEPNMSDPLFSVEGKRALITGGAGSLGTLISQALADRGALITIQDLDQERLDQVKSSIGKNNDKVFTIAADLSNVDECQSVVERASQLMGGLDIVINMAGINRRKLISEVTQEDFDVIVAVNMRAIYFVSQAAQPIMKAAGGGTIVNLSSLSARYSFNTISVYAATKAAVSSITRSTAREWAKDKIRVNCIEPSVIKTDFTKSLWGEPHRSKWFDETTPIGRLSTPDEIIGTVIFLATDASSYITGQSIVIDGGILSGGDWDSYA